MIDFNSCHPPLETRDSLGTYRDWAGETWNQRVSGRLRFINTRDIEKFEARNSDLLGHKAQELMVPLSNISETYYREILSGHLLNRDPIDHRFKQQTLSTIQEDDRPFKEN